MSFRLGSLFLVVISWWVGFGLFVYWQRAALFCQYPYPPAAYVAGMLFVAAVLLTAGFISTYQHHKATLELEGMERIAVAAGESQEMTLEDLLIRIRDATGACLFEIGTPDKDGDWEVSGWRSGRWTRQGKSLIEAALELEKALTEVLADEKKEN